MENEFESKFLNDMEEDQNELKSKLEDIAKNEALAFKKELTKEFKTLSHSLDSLQEERFIIVNDDSHIQKLIEISNYVELKRKLHLNPENEPEDPREPWEYGNIFHRLNALENAELLNQTHCEIFSKIIKTLTATTKSIDVENKKLKSQLESYANRLPYGEFTRFPHDDENFKNNFLQKKRNLTYQSMLKPVKAQRKLLKKKLEQVRQLSEECFKMRKRVMKKAEFLQNGSQDIIEKRLKQKQQLITAISLKKEDLKEIERKQKNHEFTAMAEARKAQKKIKEKEKDWRNEREVLHGQISFLKKQINEYNIKNRDDSHSIYNLTVSEIDFDEDKNIYTYENAEKALNAALEDNYSIYLAIEVEKSRKKQLCDEIKAFDQTKCNIKEFQDEVNDKEDDEITSMEQKVQLLRDELAFLKKQF